MRAGKQTTLRSRTAVAGIGVHSGLPVTLTLHPADAGTGVVFIRCGADGRPEREIRANARSVTATELATVLGDESGPGVSTIEHIMAALCGLDVEPERFRREIARARTFGFMRDVGKLWSAGYALGASLENTLVVADNRVLNPEGLRFADEFVRHKALDAIGDLALAGAPIYGAYRSVRGGHKLNHAVLTALIADPTAWTVVEERKPRPRGHAELPVGIVAPA